MIRGEVSVPVASPPIEAGQPHSTDHGSVEDELISCAAHTHTLYRDDNSEVYYKLEEARISTAYANYIKPLQRAKDS